MKKGSVIWALAGMLLVGRAASAINSLAVVGNPLIDANNGTAYVLFVNDSGGDATNVYVETAHPTNEKHYRVRFWVNPCSSVFAANKSIRMGVFGSDQAAGQHVVIFLKRNDADTSWRVNTWYKTEVTGFQAGPGVFIVGQAGQNQWRQVEIEFQAATDNTTHNGFIKLTRTAPTVSGVQQVTNLDNETFDVDYARFGILAGSGINAVGSTHYCFDEFESYR